MDSQERIQAALEMKATDQVYPFYQHLGAAKWLLQSTGLRWYDRFPDPEVFATLALASYDKYGLEKVMASWGDILVEAKLMGWCGSGRSGTSLLVSTTTSR